MVLQTKDVFLFDDCPNNAIKACEPAPHFASAPHFALISFYLKSVASQAIEYLQSCTHRVANFLLDPSNKNTVKRSVLGVVSACATLMAILSFSQLVLFGFVWGGVSSLVPSALPAQTLSELQATMPKYESDRLEAAYGPANGSGIRFYQGSPQQLSLFSDFTHMVAYYESRMVLSQEELQEQSQDPVNSKHAAFEIRFIKEERAQALENDSFPGASFLAAQWVRHEYESMGMDVAARQKEYVAAQLLNTCLAAAIALVSAWRMLLLFEQNGPRLLVLDNLSQEVPSQNCPDYMSEEDDSISSSDYSSESVDTSTEPVDTSTEPVDTNEEIAGAHTGASAETAATNTGASAETVATNAGASAETAATNVDANAASSGASVESTNISENTNPEASSETLNLSSSSSQKSE